MADLGDAGKVVVVAPRITSVWMQSTPRLDGFGAGQVAVQANNSAESFGASKGSVVITLTDTVEGDIIALFGNGVLYRRVLAGATGATFHDVEDGLFYAHSTVREQSWKITIILGVVTVEPIVPATGLNVGGGFVVAGTMSDVNGPMPNARVVLLLDGNSIDSRSESMYTDANGKYIFKGLNAGSYVVLPFDPEGAYRSKTVHVPAGAALSVGITPSPASGTATVSGSTAVAPSINVVAAVTGGMSPYTYQWARTDIYATTSFIIDSATIANPTFTIPADITDFNSTQTWACTVTDAGGVIQASASVDVTLIREQVAISNENGVTAFSLNGEVFSFQERLGWEFTVGSTDFYVSKLRVNKPSASGPERIIIHRKSDSLVMASLDLTPIADTWVEGAVSRFKLLKGVTYVISSRNVSNNARSTRRNNTHTINANVTKNANLVGVNDTMPATVSANNYVFCDFGD